MRFISIICCYLIFDYMRCLIFYLVISLLFLLLSSLSHYLSLSQYFVRCWVATHTQHGGLIVDTIGVASHRVTREVPSGHVYKLYHSQLRTTSSIYSTNIPISLHSPTMYTTLPYSHLQFLLEAGISYPDYM